MRSNVWFSTLIPSLACISQGTVDFADLPFFRHLDYIMWLNNNKQPIWQLLFYHLFLVICGTVYYCFNHITEVPLCLEGAAGTHFGGRDRQGLDQ